MKLFQKITSVVIALAIFNIVVSTAVHEIFEHHLKIHTCLNKDITHFHEFDFQHQDLICGFSISTSLISYSKSVTTNLFHHFNHRIIARYFHLVDNIYLRSFLLRGPPIIK